MNIQVAVQSVRSGDASVTTVPWSSDWPLPRPGDHVSIPVERFDDEQGAVVSVQEAREVLTVTFYPLGNPLNPSPIVGVVLQ